jgi:acyl-CoA synthetase (AMP-forming)/AMP-acid ligase II
MSKGSPQEFVNIGAQLLQRGEHSKRCAITNVDPLGVIERFTFADVAREAALWASLVRRHELRPGDRVVVLAGPAWEWRCALLGVLYAGGVGVPCPDSISTDELRAIAADAEASLIVSIQARPDFVDRDGPRVLTAEELETVDQTVASRQPPHQSLPADSALILYARTAGGLRGAVHTHGSLVAQADSGEHWLGVGEDERVWSTATDGSAESIWLLLAASRVHAAIVNLNLELDPGGQLELLDRIRPSAVWLSDEEYGVLGSADVPGWIDLGSIRRALSHDESSAGATVFADAFGAAVTPLIGLNEVGVVAGWPAGTESHAVAATAMPVPGIPLAIVDEQGKRLPPDQVGDVVVRGDAPSLCSGYMSGETKRRDSWFHLRFRGALSTDNSLQFATRPPLESELVEVDVGVPPAELVHETALEHGADELALSTRLSKREAKQARRREEREAKEQRKAEDRRRREEERSRKRAERAEERKRKEAERAEDEKRREQERLAKEREQAEAEERAGRKAAEAEERRRVEEAARTEESRREKKEKERAKAEAEERAHREAAEKEERRRAEEAARADARRREEEAKQREQARLREEEEARRLEEQLAKERARAEAEERARREAAEAEERRQAEEAARAEAEERARREAAEVEERRRAEEAARAEQQQREEEAKLREQERLRKEAEARRREEQLAKERARAEAEERARREAAEADERRRAEEAARAEAEERARREAAEAEERRRAEEAARAEARRREEEEKQREQERLRKEAEARRREEQLAKERARAEAEERARREAAEADERRRAEEAARAEERRRDEEAKQRERERREAEKEARRAEEQLAKERAKAEAEERARREAAEAEERRRAEEAARAEEHRRVKEEKQREQERRRDEKEARRREERQAKEAARAERKTARLGRRRRSKDSEPHVNAEREEDSQLEPEREHVAADIRSRISLYGMNAASTAPDARPEAEATTDLSSPPEPAEEENVK